MTRILQEGEQLAFLRGLVGRVVCECPASRDTAEPCICKRADNAHAHSDAGDHLDLRKSTRWLGVARASAVAAEEDEDPIERRHPTNRKLMTETLIEAARSIGEDSPEHVAAIRGASLDQLRAAFIELPDGPEKTTNDPTERTDFMTDTEAEARHRMNRDAHTAHLRPLGSGLPRDAEPELTSDDRVRIDAAGAEFDRREREHQAFLNRDDMRVDAAVRDPKTGLPTYTVEPSDEDDETKARRRLQRRSEQAWQRPMNRHDLADLERQEMALANAKEGL